VCVRYTLLSIIAIIWLNQKVGHEQDGPER
jgi:hypothetical protein